MELGDFRRNNFNNDIAIRYATASADAFTHALNTNSRKDAEKIVADALFNPGFCGNRAIVCALNNKYSDLALRMVMDPRVDPAANDNVLMRAAVSNGEIEIVKILLADERDSSSIPIALSTAVIFSEIEILKILLKDSRAQLSDGLIHCAIRFNRTDTLKLLLDDHRVKCREDSNYLIIAIMHNSVGSVAILLAHPRIDPSVSNNHAIRVASDCGYIEIVQMLLEDRRVDPSVRNNIAFRSVAWKGYENIMYRLLADPRVNPCAKNNRALGNASVQGHYGIVKTLLGVCVGTVGQYISLKNRLPYEINTLWVEYLSKHYWVVKEFARIHLLVDLIREIMT